jgi:hypothetical protein
MSAVPEPQSTGQKRLEELARAQGVKPLTDPLAELGCPDLWDSDEEFQEFLEWLRRCRQEGR